jgi:hypothetical protein
MSQVKKNKEFVIGYFNAISGLTKTRELCEQYISDQALIGHILFFDGAFPKYEMFIDEITGEDKRIVVRGRFKGKHAHAQRSILPFRNWLRN